MASISTSFPDMTYEQFISFVTKPNSDLLNSIKNKLALINYTSHHVMIIKAYAMCYYPEDIFPDEKEDIDFCITKLAHVLVSKIENRDKTSFHECLSSFEDQFSKWKFHDSKRIASVFAKELDAYKSFKDKMKDTPEFVDGIAKVENKIQMRISQLDPTFFSQNSSSSNSSFPVSLKTGIGPCTSSAYSLPGSNVPFLNKSSTLELFEEIFWKRIKNDIRNNDYACLIPLLRDVASGIKKLVPNNIKFLENLAENLDIELLQQKIDGKILAPDDLFQYMDFIIDRVSQLQSAYEANITSNWWRNTREEMTNSRFFRYEYYIPLIFKVVLNKLERTYDIVNSPDVINIKKTLAEKL